MEFGRKLHSLGEIYTILYKGIRSAPYMSKAKRMKDKGKTRKDKGTGTMSLFYFVY